MVTTPVLIPLFRIAAFACAGAASLLVVMLLLPWPFEFGFPGIDVLSGARSLSSGEMIEYREAMAIQYAIDSVFIACWIIAWVAICAGLLSVNRTLGGVALVLGLIGPLLDITENAVIGYLLTGIENGAAGDPDTIAQWAMVRQASYLIPFMASLVLVAGLWLGRMIRAWILFVWAGVTGLAIVGIYLPVIGWMSDMWWLLLFLGGLTLTLPVALSSSTSSMPQNDTPV